jgi:hypothetical protein
MNTQQPSAKRVVWLAHAKKKIGDSKSDAKRGAYQEGGSARLTAPDVEDHRSDEEKKGGESD